MPLTRALQSFAALLLLSAVVSGPVHAAEARLLRFPALQGGRIAFTYAGDLYLVPDTGGTARRLTSHIGQEMFPHFSPDGKWLAFTAQYDGNTEVYVMPSEGGEPRRLTYTATLDRDDVADRMGPNNIVMGWRDDATIVYRSRGEEWNPFKGRLYLVRLEGGPPEQIPLPRGGWCSFSPDGKQLAYNRVFREFRTWKRYRGGQADDLWLYDFASRQTTRLTEDPAQDLYPMWRGDRIYFVSERDTNHQANLFVQQVGSKQARQLTQFTEFAVKFPTLGDTGIVFENGGWIYRLDLGSEQAVKVPIEIQEDGASGRGGWRDVSKETTSHDISPDGNRAVIGARGDVFTVPAKHGPTRNLTASPGVHERDATWSPDGHWIAMVSDESGEDEIWIRPQDGGGKPRQLTANADTYKYAPQWSPDSKRLAWTDKKNRLQYVEIDGGAVTVVVQSPDWEIPSFSWAPDSQWMAYSEPERANYGRIVLYSLANRQSIPATDSWFRSASPEFSSDGKFLFFISSRSFNPTIGSTEWNHIYQDMERVYLVTLARDTKSPFAPKSDEVKPQDEKKPDAKKDSPPDVKASAGEDGKAGEGTAGKADKDKDKDKDKSAGKEKPEKVVVKVEADGLVDRIAVLPPPASDYGSLGSAGSKLYYKRKEKLFVYDLENEKETELGEVEDYRISADLKKMLVKAGGTFAIIDLPSAKLDLAEHKLGLGDLRVELDRAAEWREIFTACWRHMRDFYFDPGMSHVDWAAMRQRYEPLLAYVRQRDDLTYVIGEMIGELSTGHTYVGGGDQPKPERVPMGLLGARIEKDPSGYYRVARILRGQNWDPESRSPLTEIGVNIRTNDFILSVNGRSVRDPKTFQELLAGQAGKQVRLRVNSSPREDGAREETVIPTASEQHLYYVDWVLGNIDKVARASGGRIGYVHIPDMGTPGLNEFSKLFYAQLDREGLVVDCRGNGGGNVSPMIIERLRREPAMWDVSRNGSVNVDPHGQALGPKVLLLDQFSASDGDIVGYRFRKHGLGPIIGKRSWGGVVGIRGSQPLLDGGFMNSPEYSRFDLEGKEWIMEGVGVEPDIEVDNDPAHEYDGIDDQLNRGVEEVLKRLAERPVKIPAPPPPPDKRK